ncbi:uncharacterized protein LOC135132367 isoform X1 [Zophobas morio]|uniref:uncharacterized protein LOC135132367 isoform X1 n=1 Tax=Zophobas morio TaxID=2755281 RepID=UPI003083B97F
MNKCFIYVLIYSTCVINMVLLESLTLDQIRVPETTSSVLHCYQCNPATQECEDNKADVIKCGSMSIFRCSRQVRKDSPDKSKALRKCVIADRDGYVGCPNEYECFNCNQSLCNANPIVTTTSLSSSSPLITNCIWPAVVSAIFVVIYS